MPLLDAYDVLTALETVEDDFLSMVSNAKPTADVRMEID